MNIKYETAESRFLEQCGIRRHIDTQYLKVTQLMPDMNEPEAKRSLKRIAGRMQEILGHGDIDDVARGELQELAKETEHLQDEFSDSRIKTTIREIVKIVFGATVGYLLTYLPTTVEYLQNLI